MKTLSKLAALLLISATFVFWFSFPMKAAGEIDYFVCNCEDNADADCVAGNDSNSGTDPSTPWQTYEKARSEFGSLAGGDTIHFCQGGSFDLGSSSRRWVNSNCSAAMPCTVSNYQPPWASGDEGLPLMLMTESGWAFNFDDGGEADRESGYVFENLALLCTVCDLDTLGTGFFLWNDIDDVIIQNVHIDSFSIGVHLAGSNPCGDDPTCNAHNERLTIRNAIMVNNHRGGFLGSGNDLLIENSYFENNGFLGPSGPTGHHIYISGSQSPSSGIQVRGNELYRNALLDGSCDAVSLVAHGEHHDLTIEDNLVREDVGFANERCWGIAVDPGYFDPELFENVVIRGNTVMNVGNVSIGVASCVNCMIENNIVIQQQSFGAKGIAAPDRTRGAEDAMGSNITVRNNSILISGEGTGIQLNTEGTNHTLVSNAISFTGNNSNWNCLRANLPPSSYAAIDNNICGYAAGEWADGVGDLADWQSAGWGAQSQETSPGFTSSTDLAPSGAASALVNAGHPTLSAVIDITGVTRDTLPDVGAYEWVDGLPNDTIGLYNSTYAVYYLKTVNEGGAPDIVFQYGATDPSWIPLMGDWDSDGVDTVGVYVPSTSTFFLKDTNAGGASDYSIQYGPPGAGWLPLVGDWDGDGDDTLGIYDPSSSAFYLSNELAGGAIPPIFYGAPGWTPLTGDWDGDGTDTVGVYSPTIAAYYLRNSNTNGGPDFVFQYGAIDPTWVPLMGDWDGDGDDTVGVYLPANSLFFLKNTNAGGASDLSIQYGSPGAGWIPLKGNFE